MDLTNLNKDRKTRRKSGSMDLGTMMYGKVPPQAKDLEDAILGAIMLDTSAFLKVFEILKAQCFYVESNQRIFRAMEGLKDKNSPIDLLTVVEELKAREELDVVGGPYYVTKLTNAVVSAANIQAHSRIVLQKYVQREVIRMSGELIGDAYEDSTDIFDLLHNASEQLKGINTTIAETKRIQIKNITGDVVVSLANKRENAINEFVDPKLIYTLIPEWDRINGPLFPGLYVIAARPGMGKGVHMTECVSRMAVKYKCGVVNGEMTNKQFITRLGCNIRSIDNFLWKKNPKTITEDELIQVYEAMQAVNDLKLYLDDSIYIDRIVNKIRMWVEQDGVQAVFADFLQMFNVPDEKSRYMTETDKMNYIMEKFRALSKELGIPIFLYSQLNRENLKRGTHEPNLGDLKGSGKIEEFAYQISFLHRPEYYDDKAVFDELGESVKGLMYQIIAKHREGETGKIKHFAKLSMSQLIEWSGNLVDDWKTDTPF